MSELKIGLIGGTGLGQALAGAQGVRHEIDTPFGRPSDAIIETVWEGVTVLVLSRHGPGHLLNPSQVPFRANIHALKQLGCTHILASGAVGSLREEFRPRDLVIPDQIIDKTHKRANTFFEHVAVHVEFAEPFCPVLRRILLESAVEEDEDKETTGQGDKENAEKEHSALGTQNSELPSPTPQDFRVHDRGCYVCMEGPAFSTRAESLMHRLWGGDLIGMTAMPEAKLAREAEIPYALVALVTDYDCWRNKPVPVKPAETGAAQPASIDPHELLNEILHNLHVATDNAVTLIKRAVALMSQRRDLLQTCPASRALELAIWSNKSQIAPEQVQRLGLLWMKYFEGQPS